MDTHYTMAFTQPCLTYLLAMWPFAVGLPIGVRAVRHWWPEASISPLWFIPAVMTVGCGYTIALTFTLLTCRIAFAWMLIVISIPSAIVLCIDIHFWKRTIQNWKSKFASADAIDRLTGIGITILTIFLLLLARIPPLNYDAHEYHLAVQEHYVSAGRWVTLPLNVFAGFPMNIELLYFWGLAWNSIASTTVMHTMLGFGAALGAGGIARLLGCRHGSLATLIYLGSGLLQLQCLQANIDHGPALFGAVTFMGVLIPASGTTGWAILSSIALGLALGCKYVTVISIAIPWCFLIGWRTITQRIPVWKSIVILVGLPVLLVIPWLMRNALLYGNPFHPLLAAWFQFASWDAVSARFFNATVSPKVESFREQWINFCKHIPGWIFGNSLGTTLGPLGWLFWNTKGHIALLGIPLAAIPPRLASNSEPTSPTSAIRIGLLGTFISVGLWIHFTQGEERFLIPLYPLLSALALCGLERIPNPWGICLTWAGSVGTTLFVAFTVAVSLNPYSYLIGRETEREFLSNQLPHFRAIEYLNRLSDSESIHVIFIGEAQETGAGFPRHVTVVYNQHPLLDFDSDGKVLPLNINRVRQKLQDLRVSHVFVNLWELKRLTEGYGPMGWEQGILLRQLVIQLETEGILLPLPDSLWNGRAGYTIYRINIQSEE